MTLSSDLSLSRAGRAEQARRVAHVAAIAGGPGGAHLEPILINRRLARSR